MKMANSGFSPSLTTWSLLGLAGGLALGIVGFGLASPWVGMFADTVQPLGTLWVTALQMTVLPLVVTHMLAAIVGRAGAEGVGSLGGRAIVLFVAMLVLAGIFTVALAPPLIRLYEVAPETVAAIQGQTSVPQSARDAAVAAPASVGEWLAGIIPRNVFEAAVRGDILPLLLFTVVFGLAVNRLPLPRRAALADIFQSLAQAMLTVVRWILWGTPIGVFALTLALAMETGAEAVGLLGMFVLVSSGLMLLFTAVLYPFSAILGRVPVAAFARAVAPAQLVAVSTRSSIASLPALIEGARDALRLPDQATGFVLPLCVSAFKVNRTISSPVKLLFLAHIYGIQLGAAELAGFLITVIILSFSAVGVPGGGGAFRTLPAYLAAGIPIEGVVLMEAVDTIPDIFKTLVNVTGDMSVATLLSRGWRVAGRIPATAAARDPAVLTGDAA